MTFDEVPSYDDGDTVEFPVQPSRRGIKVNLSAQFARVRADERARVLAAVGDLIVDDPMWIGDDGEPLDYLPEREARIAAFLQRVAGEVLP